jgi:hypothetical protein
MFQRLPRHLMPCQMILFAVLLLGGPMGVSRGFMKFGGALMVFVMRPVVVSLRHQMVTI